jgi:hypothetical protein
LRSCLAQLRAWRVALFSGLPSPVHPLLFYLCFIVVFFPKTLFLYLFWFQFVQTTLVVSSVVFLMNLVPNHTVLLSAEQKSRLYSKFLLTIKRFFEKKVRGKAREILGKLRFEEGERGKKGFDSFEKSSGR